MQKLEEKAQEDIDYYMKAIVEYQQNDNELDDLRGELQEQKRKNKKFIKVNAELKMKINTLSSVKDEENKETEEEY